MSGRRIPLHYRPWGTSQGRTPSCCRWAPFSVASALLSSTTSWPLVCACSRVVVPLTLIDVALSPPHSLTHSPTHWRRLSPSLSSSPTHIILAHTLSLARSLLLCDESACAAVCGDCSGGSLHAACQLVREALAEPLACIVAVEIAELEVQHAPPPPAAVASALCCCLFALALLAAVVVAAVVAAAAAGAFPASTAALTRRV